MVYLLDGEDVEYNNSPPVGIRYMKKDKIPKSINAIASNTAIAFKIYLENRFTI